MLIKEPLVTVKRFLMEITKGYDMMKYTETVRLVVEEMGNTTFEIKLMEDKRYSLFVKTAHKDIVVVFNHFKTAERRYYAEIKEYRDGIDSDKGVEVSKEDFDEAHSRDHWK